MSGSDARALSRSLLDLCRMRKLTIATAESCTGGLIATVLSEAPAPQNILTAVLSPIRLSKNARLSSWTNTVLSVLR